MSIIIIMDDMTTRACRTGSLSLLSKKRSLLKSSRSVAPYIFGQRSPDRWRRIWLERRLLRGVALLQLVARRRLFPSVVISFDGSCCCWVRSDRINQPSCSNIIHHKKKPRRLSLLRHFVLSRWYIKMMMRERSLLLPFLSLLFFFLLANKNKNRWCYFVS